MINDTIAEIVQFEALPHITSDLDAYVNKLTSAKKKLAAVNTLLSSTQVQSPHA